MITAEAANRMFFHLDLLSALERAGERTDRSAALCQRAPEPWLNDSEVKTALRLAVLLLARHLHLIFPETCMSAQPIELHYWPTPNGWKVSIALERWVFPTP